MTNIFFLSKDIADPIKEPSVQPLVSGYHLYQSQGEGETWVYGVCYPKDVCSPLDVVRALEALGIHVLPSVHDQETEVHPEVHKHLAKHGVVPGDKAHAVAKKMHQAAGRPPFEPHLY
jgi:hypothetical protein